MPNYHIGLILSVDIALAAAIIVLCLETILSAIIGEHSARRRNKKLFNIKRNVYELVLSGKKIDAQVCMPVASELTPQQFLDIATNRNRDTVFFNESEQKVLKDCFASKERIGQVEKIAANPWNKWRRIEAILSLGYAQVDSSLEVLKNCLNSRDSDISYFSIIALGQIRSLESAEILLKFLRKRHIYFYKIFSVLEEFPDGIAGKVVFLTHDREAQVRVWAVQLIAKLKAARYLQRIEELAQDKSGEVRAAVCDCLGEFRLVKAQGTLEKYLRDDFWLVRVHAVTALSKVLGKNCLTQVMSCINDSSLSVIESLKSVIFEHLESAVGYLENFLYGNDEMAKRVAVEVLEASGYINNIFKNLLSSDNETGNRFRRLLEGLIKAGAHFGLEAGLAGLSREKRENILQIITEIDPAVAGHFRESITKGFAELR